MSHVSATPHQHSIVDLLLGDLEAGALQSCPYDFSFRACGLRFRAHIGPPGAPRLEMAAVLGRLPYSLEDPKSRQGASAVLEAGRIVGDVRFDVEDGQQVVARRERTLPGDDDARVLVTLLVEFALAVKPYADLLQRHLRPA